MTVPVGKAKAIRVSVVSNFFSDTTGINFVFARQRITPFSMMLLIQDGQRFFFSLQVGT